MGGEHHLWPKDGLHTNFQTIPARYHALFFRSSAKEICPKGMGNWKSTSHVPVTCPPQLTCEKISVYPRKYLFFRLQRAKNRHIISVYPRKCNVCEGIMKFRTLEGILNLAGLLKISLRVYWNLRNSKVYWIVRVYWNLWEHVEGILK